MRQWILLLTVVGLLPLTSQESQPPYLFYYSYMDKAFVIERADGTDTRLFAEGVMQPDENAVFGPGWSPSGEWFAWTGQMLVSEGMDGPSRPHLVSVDGTRSSVLDAYPHAWVQWAPDADLLLVVGQDYTPTVHVKTQHAFDTATEKRTLTLYAAIIDPATDEVLVTQRWRAPSFSSWAAAPHSIVEWGWTHDGQYAVMCREIATWAAGNSSGSTVFYAIGLDGIVVEREYDGLWQDWWFPGSDYVTYYDNDTLIVENIITGAHERFEDAPPQIGKIEWRQDGRYALTLASLCPGETTWTCDNIQLSLLMRDEGRFSDVYSPVADVNAILGMESPWSPDGSRAIFLANSGSFYLFDFAQRTVTRLTDPEEDMHYLTNTSWHWQGDDYIVLGSKRLDNGYEEVKACNLNTIACDLYEVGTYRSTLDLSADRRYAAYVWVEVGVIDTASGDFHVFAPDSRSYATSSGGEIFWHPTADWFIIREDALVAGGANVRWTGVADASGTRRELSYCWASPVCIDWLPPQVDPAWLAPGHDPTPDLEPVTVLHGDRWNWYLSWSPDNTHLLAGCEPIGNPDKSTLWDVVHQEPVSSFPGIGWQEDVHWLTPDGPGYILRFVTRDGVSGCNYCIASPDGSQRIVWAGVEDVATGEMLMSFKDYLSSYPSSISFSADGRWLAATVAYARANSHVAIWDTTTWEEIGVILGVFQGVAFSPDGRWIAASHSWDISIWAVSDVLTTG